MINIVQFRNLRCPKCSFFTRFIGKLNRSKMSASFNKPKGYLLDDFSHFKFSPCKLLSLPVEINRDNYVRRYIKGVAFSHVDPTPVISPRLVVYSDDALIDILELDPKVTESKDFINFIAGNNVLASSTPIAHRYGGHQFGVWAMQLGDGRAILLGEYVNRKGERWELQLKGAGKTPYSRDGDGRAVLRSSIREFLCSEAMYYLGIPTTRAGALVVADDKVARDLLYDGHVIMEPAAVLLRLAPSWFRIGSLELPSKVLEHELLNQLVHFIIHEHFPDLVQTDQALMVVNFLKQVFRLNSDLVVHWQTVGFTHGVLNTDNISLLGLTIDYGPFGFLEEYDPFYVPNYSDHDARYCYGRQIQIMLFNLMMLCNALSPLLPAEVDVSLLLQAEAAYIEEKITERFSQKLGFKDIQTHLVQKLIVMMEETKSDFTMVFRQLSETPLSGLGNPSSDLWALKTLSSNPDYSTFIEEYREKINLAEITDGERMETMCSLNPRYVLRNWMAQQAINQAEKNNDFSEVNLLLQVLKNPFTKQDEAEEKGYASEPPKWSKKLCLSCSS